MATIREIKLTGSKSDDARLICSVHGKLTDFASGSIVVRVQQGACYNLLVVCEGKAGNEASVEIEAVHRDCKLVGCSEDGQPGTRGFEKVTATIPTNEITALALDRFAVVVVAKPGNAK